MSTFLEKFSHGVNQKKMPKCFACLQEFTMTDHKVPKRPLLLNCGHSICQNCAFRRTTINCRVCGESSSRGFGSRFEYDIFKLGYLNHLKLQRGYQEPVQLKIQLNCQECQIAPTESICDKCNLAFCGPCFEKTHVKKAWRNHKLVSAQNQVDLFYGLLDDPFCSKHQNQTDNYCRVCKTKVCNICYQRCAIQQHEMVSIKEENERLAGHMISYVNELMDSQNKVVSKIQDISHLIEKYTAIGETKVLELSEWFFYLHGVLQATEKIMTDKIKGNLHSMIKEFHDIKKQLSDSKDMIDIAIANTNRVLENPPVFNSMEAYGKRISDSLMNSLVDCDISDLPGENLFNYEVWNDVVAEIRNNCRITNDLPINLNIQKKFYQPNEIFSSTSVDTSNETKPSTSKASKKYPNPMNAKFANSARKSSTSSSIRVKSVDQINDPEMPQQILKKRKKDSQQKRKQKQQQKKNEQAMVAHTLEDVSFLNELANLYALKARVIHVKSPSQFYVRLFDWDSHYNRKIEHLCHRDGNRPNSKVTNLKLREIYLVWFAEESKFYRVRYDGPMDDADPSQSANNLKIYYIDFGKEEYVSIERLQECSNELACIPAGAILCAIHSLKPKDDCWPPEIPWIFSRMTTKDPLLMVRFIIHNDCNYVDLIVERKNNMYSVRDALISLGFAERSIDNVIKSDESASRRAKTLEWKSKIYYKEARSKKRIFEMSGEVSEEFRVIVQKAFSPSEFYVSRYEDINYYTEMNVKLQEYYANEKNRQCVWFFEKGQYCVVHGTNLFSRAEILEDVNDKHEVPVRFIDDGRLLNVPFHAIYELAEEFYGYSKGTIKCALSNIEPLKSNCFIWTDSAKSTFINHAMSKHEIFIRVDKSMDSMKQVTLFEVVGDKKTNINALLCALKMANNTSKANEIVEISSNKDYTIVRDLQDLNITQPIQLSKKNRERVVLVHVVSPSEFYFTLKRHVKGVAEIHRSVQEYVYDSENNNINNDSMMMEDVTMVDWKVDEYCLVQTSDHVIGKMWYRARIIELLPDGSYKVRLRDKGSMVKVQRADMRICPVEFSSVVDGAICSHLAGVIPPAGSKNWPGSALDKFKHLVTQIFSEFAVSIYGEREPGTRSLPVILWGLVYNEDDLIPSRLEYHNLLQNFVLSGYAGTKFSIDIKDEFFDQQVANNGYEDIERWRKRAFRRFDRAFHQKELTESEIQQMPTEDEEFILCGRLRVSKQMRKIKAWPPAIPLRKTIFVGICTFVGEDGTIYLQDAEQVFEVNFLKKTLTKYYKRLRATVPANKGIPDNTPVIVKYYVDNNYHRGIILGKSEIKDKDYRVYFADYGNIEDCSADDIFEEVMCDEVPLMVHRYKLTKLEPFAGSYTQEQIDHIHFSIVDTWCQIRVDTNLVDIDKTTAEEIIPCFLNFTSKDTRRKTDLREILVDLKVAKYVKTKEKFLGEPEMKVDPSRHRSDAERMTNFMREQSDYCLNQVVDTESDETQRLINKMEQKLYDQPVNDDDVGGLFDSKLEDLFSDPENATLNDIAEIPEDNNETMNYTIASKFEPMETSSKYNDQNNRMKHQEDLLMTLDLRALNIKEFRCFLVSYKDALNFYVDPDIKTHVQNMKELEELLTHLKSNPEQMTPITKIVPNMLCMAYYKESNLWARAQLEDYDEKLNQFRVNLIDYYSVVTLKKEDLREFVPSLMEFEKRVVQIRLHNLMKNPSCDPVAIEDKMVMTLKSKELFAKVRGFGRNNVPEVELYLEPDDEDSLAYKSLVRHGYFLNIHSK